MVNYWWSDPVFDREKADVDHATRKGQLRASDMNRIENNIGWLASRWGLALDIKQWNIGAFLTQPEIARVVANAQQIKAGFNITANPFNTLLFWGDLNAIERVLFDSWNRYRTWTEWDCIECKFDTLDDLEGLTWDRLEDLQCTERVSWDGVASGYENIDDMESSELSWNDIECLRSEE